MRPSHAELSLVDERQPEPRGLTLSDLMTAREVAEMLRVPVSTVREWGRRGILPRVKLGHHVRFIRSHVEAAILRAEQPGAGSQRARETRRQPC